MIEDTLPVNDVQNAYMCLKLKMQAGVAVAALLSLAAIAIIYDGETLLPVMGVLGGVVGAVFGGAYVNKKVGQ